MKRAAALVTSLWVLCAAGACGEERPVGRARSRECPSRMVAIPGAGACIDRHEAALEGHGARARAVPATDRAPATSMSFEAADRACREAGYRLCTEREWLRACAGEDARRYPFGDEHEAHRCNIAEDDDDLSTIDVVPSGRFERCVTPEGVFDLVGNVAEWIDHPDESGILRELRGGSAHVPERYARCEIGDRFFQPMDSAHDGQGFRCCWSAP